METRQKKLTWLYSDHQKSKKDSTQWPIGQQAYSQSSGLRLEFYSDH